MEFIGNIKPNAELQSKIIRNINDFSNILKSRSKRKLYRIADKQFRQKYKKDNLWTPRIDDIAVIKVEIKTEVFISAFFKIKGKDDKIDFDKVFRINFIAQNKAYKTNKNKCFKYNPLSIKII